jgi:hypothetical protein
MSLQIINEVFVSQPNYFLAIILDSVNFLCPQVHILPGWRLGTRLSTHCYYYCSILARSSKSKSHCDWRSGSQSVSLGVEPRLGLMTRYLLLFDSYGLVLCGTPSLTRGRVCLLYVLLALVSAVSLGSEWTRDNILLCQISDFAFRRLLRLAGSFWLYPFITPRHGPHGKQPVLLRGVYRADA